MQWMSALHLVTLSLLYSFAQAVVPCTTNDECERILMEGSECLEEGFCSNPFYYKGCLGTYLPEYSTRPRVCSSDDPPEALEKGYCRIPELDYMETRILSQNWESSFFSVWLLQIVLNELLGVPVSIEVAQPDFRMDLYDRIADISWGQTAANYDEITVGSEIQDCRKIKTDDLETYTPCAHIILEGWRTEHADPIAEKPRDLGVLGSHHWWIPRFAAENDTSLVYYYGLAGERNRRKMAEVFKRPTTWKDYCGQVSLDNCTTSNEVAARPPTTEAEEDSMFAAGLYTGHFRATEKNDCDRFPDTCTGHIADFPCFWQTYTVQQAYHLDIALESDGPFANGGYTYAQLRQIWAAANATKSPVIMLYWEPESLYQAYIGTEAEFTRVVLPPPTQGCVDARVNVSSECTDTIAEKFGDPEGACDWPPQSIKKVISRSFHSATTSSDLPEALWSPAYDAFVNFQVSSLQYGEMFQNWFERDGDKWGFHLRDAACRWAVENIDSLESFIPETFPRVVEDEPVSEDVIFSLALVVACLALLLVLATFIATYCKKNTKSIYYAQFPFLALVLMGLLLVAMASLALPLPPSDGSCLFILWATDIGFTLQLVPLVLRIYSINKLASSGNQMQRVHLNLKLIVKTALVGLSVVCAFLAAWSFLDVPSKRIQYDLTARETSKGERIVASSDYCGSDSDVWMFLSIAWQALLLLPGVVVAFVASLVKEDMNDTSTLGLTLSSHLVFLLLRATVLSLGDDHRSDSMLYTSLILSADTMTVLAVYFLPKLMYSGDDIDSEILPDLFLNTTVMMSDIEGFTAWSSVREPIQVFKFLETLYENFDVIAERHKIFKVETTGEHYVTAAGLPEYRSDHAVMMARFASDIMKKMEVLLKKLEIQFGPDTCDLSLRIGIHSGPVTGGFMKGKQSRFQLFGDTMTTTGLIHETGESSRIHVSDKTATLLIEAGRKNWIRERDQKVVTVEKGEMQTYWLTRHRQDREDGERISASNASAPSIAGSSDYAGEEDEINGLDSEQRWVEWNMATLRPLVQKIVARRQTQPGNARSRGIRVELVSDADMPLNEVKEIIELPAFDKEAAKRQHQNQSKVVLSNSVADQLRDYITHVAGMYKQNPFHSFAHASYVVMAVSKYMNRIIAASEIDVGYDEDHHRSSTHAAIHDHTYGITSDPLTQFACVFSALIHDIDHPGVPNAQLIKEGKRVASIYKNRSIAEQNSFDMAWDLLIDPAYDELRSTICSTDVELKRFRSLVINSVMATDLGDQELKALRNGRWSKAFDEAMQSERDHDAEVAINRKATIVIEHLIQAADVAHTCQHWNIYRKWNQRLFEECYVAYENGRADKNPVDYWYEGEIGFFDFYIIPLSQKLRDCGVFGSTSDENLNYAENNRAMWIAEGEQIVAEMWAQLERNNRTGVSKVIVVGGTTKTE